MSYIKSFNKSSICAVLIITTFAIGLYANTLKNGFVGDDDYTIVNNTLINKLDNLSLLLNKTAYFNRSTEMSYRPVVTFTYFVDYALYGLKPWGYHLTNILLHAINGAMLYFFLTLLLTPYSLCLMSPAFLISLLFVTHPVLTEAVNCISYREDLLAFLFYMATLSLYLTLRKPTIGHRSATTAVLYLLSCLAYFFALLSKEMAVTLPLIIFCYEWIYGKEKTSLSSRFLNRYTIGYITITFFYLYLRFYLFHYSNEQIGAWSLVERLLTLPWLIMSYLRLSLIPVQLSADYVIDPVISPFSSPFILPVITLASLFTIILLHSPLDPFPSTEVKQTLPSPLTGEGQGEREFSGQRSILFGALFFLLTLAPVYNLVPLPRPLAERYLYLPIVGFNLFAVIFVYLIAEKLKIPPKYRNRYAFSLCLIVATIFSFYVVKRNAVWKDNYSLWSGIVATLPNNSRAHNNLGTVYANQGNYELAVQEYLTAIRLNPLYPEAYNNLGAAYADQGHYELAMQQYKNAIILNPKNPRSHYNLANVYYDRNLYDEAILEYKAAIMLNKKFAEAHYNLGLAYAKKGLKAEAIKEFEMTIRMKPDFLPAKQALESL